MFARAAVAVAAAAAVAAGATIGAAGSPVRADPFTVRATAPSYVPGQRVELLVTGRQRLLELQILRAGGERAWNAAGRAWGPPHAVRLRGRRFERVRFRIGAWASGLYFARLTTRYGHARFAPFIVRPTVLGGSRVAVVLPTYTWQAYNFYDMNADGRPDSWYADPRRRSVNLGATVRRQRQAAALPLLRPRVPALPGARGKGCHVLGDDDLDRLATGEELARLYDLIIFSGHEEYVSGHVYDIVERYRDLGGNLAFLSPNNFFWRVDRVGRRIWRIKRWRDLGRPEARLVGVQYRANDRGGHAAPYVVVAPDTWLFGGLDVASGASLGSARFGIEFDMITADSPPGTQLLAEVDPHLGNDTIRGQMSYYETPAGAKVFAAGDHWVRRRRQPARAFALQQHLAAPDPALTALAVGGRAEDSSPPARLDGDWRWSYETSRCYRCRAGSRRRAWRSSASRGRIRSVSSSSTSRRTCAPM